MSGRRTRTDADLLDRPNPPGTKYNGNSKRHTFLPRHDCSPPRRVDATNIGIANSSHQFGVGPLFSLRRLKPTHSHVRSCRPPCRCQVSFLWRGYLSEMECGRGIAREPVSRAANASPSADKTDRQTASAITGNCSGRSVG